MHKAYNTVHKRKSFVLIWPQQHNLRSTDIVLTKESLPKPKVSARQQCVYEGPERRNQSQITARNMVLKSKFTG